jgi:hypothetical protein
MDRRLLVLIVAAVVPHRSSKRNSIRIQVDDRHNKHIWTK